MAGAAAMLIHSGLWRGGVLFERVIVSSVIALFGFGMFFILRAQIKGFQAPHDVDE